MQAEFHRVEADAFAVQADAAIDRYRELRVRAERWSGTTRGLEGERQAARERLGRVSSRLAEVEAQRADRPITVGAKARRSAFDAELERLRREESAARADVERYAAELRVLGPRVGAATMIAESCRRWLTDRGVGLSGAAAVIPDPERVLRDLATLRPARKADPKRLSAVREQIAAAVGKRQAVEAGPAAREEVLHEIDAAIERKAKSWRPHLGCLASGGEGFTLAFGWRDTTADAQAEAMLCALVPEAVRTTLREQAEKHIGEHGEGLPLAERAKRIAELDAERDALELEEEALVRTLERQGLDIDRRGEARPEIVLAGEAA